MTDAVYVRIVGGLANQMFQYATALALARRLDSPLKLDLSAFEIYKPHPFRLDKLSIRADTATEAELAQFKPVRRRTSRILPRWARPPKPAARNYYREPHFHYDPRLLELRAPVLIDGYWQSPRYFKDRRPELLEEFSLSESPPSDLATLREQILAGMSISVHVRRGDYVANQDVARVHGALKLDYYRRAIDIMSRLYPEAVFYVFSDDSEYVRSEFDLRPNSVMVRGDHNQPHLDLWLMQACRHHIIANSSFSWWGAWLNDRPDKTVIAPRRWFTTAMLLETYTYDLYPAEWITLG